MSGPVFPPSRAVALLVVAAALGGVVGAGLGQQVQECGPVGLEPADRERTVSGGESARILVDVTNEGAVPGTAWVNATAAPGWATSVEPSSLYLNATETKEAEVQASPAEGADESRSPYELTLTAELECSVEGFGAAGSDSTEETVDIQLQGASGSGSSDGGSPLTTLPGVGLLLVGAVAILGVVGYPMVRSRTRDWVDAGSPEPVKTVAAGEGVAFPLVVENVGDEAGTADLEIEAVPEGWSGFIAVPSVEVEPGTEETVEVLLRAPQETKGTNGASVLVHVQPAEAELEATLVELTARLDRG